MCGISYAAYVMYVMEMNSVKSVIKKRTTGCFYTAPYGSNDSVFHSAVK